MQNMALVDWGRLKMQNKDVKRFFNSGEKPVIAEKLGVTGSFYLRIYVFGGSFCPRIKSWLYLRGSSLTAGSFAGCPVDCKEKL